MFALTSNLIINADINIVILCSHLVQPGRGPQPPAERGRAHHQGPEEDRGGGRGQAPGRQPHEGGVGPAEDGELKFLHIIYHISTILTMYGYFSGCGKRQREKR